MKFNKILSSALTVVMLFMAIVGVIPATKVSAEMTKTDTQLELSTEEIAAIINSASNIEYATSEDMLEAELESGYLMSVTDHSGKYSIYVNKYTGVFYYRNNLTGQILTSNPYSFEGLSNTDTKEMLLSQIIIDYNALSSTTKKDPFYSFKDAAKNQQIAVEFMKDGIRVNYVLGDIGDFLLPGRMTAKKFEALVVVPSLNALAELLQEYCGDTGMVYSVFENTDYTAYKNGVINRKGAGSLEKYIEDIRIFIDEQRKAGKITQAQADELETVRNDAKKFTGESPYILTNPKQYREGSTNYNYHVENYYTPAKGVDPELEIFKTLEPMYVFNDKNSTLAVKKETSQIFTKYAKDYTFEQMEIDQAECGYITSSEDKPSFNCSIEYSFNADGTLSVRVPANSITFDETLYILNSISILPYFGAGNIISDGYLFYPDGSGSVTEFEDFRDKVNITTSKLIYGTDYAYSKVTGKHHEQVTLPVYGIVNEVPANETTSAITGKDTVTNGYFAILEEGESLAKLNVAYDYKKHDFIYSYCSYTPYPSDVYDLSDQISVGGNESYTMTAKNKFNGSYVTRIVMLDDENTAKALSNITGSAQTYYPASYVGMATYYREFLKANGTLTALEATTNKLPLYIEALGSMEIVKKILSFPVTAKLELTTFEDIGKMYDELSNAKDKFLEKAGEYDAKAEGTEDEELKASYKATADEYRTLSSEIENIVNINFCLTGFGNGGLSATYPTKVRWDKAVGGKKGLNALIAKSSEVANTVGASLGIFPEYDFMYLNHTDVFDGFTQKGNLSKMIDNRYASKQTWNSVLGMHESFFTMVINPASLDKLYTKFVSQYSKYDLSGVSVSTLGSDLNSNFDDDETVNRDEAMSYVEGVLSKLAYSDKYDIMTSVGNRYTLKYVNHIIDASVDSSHLRYSSYSVPFVGMILHGYVNYTGSAINYSGNRDYDILRSIESGASLYYILCYQNSSFLKEDETLNKYYGVDYSTWFDSIVTSYAELNGAIGDLQNYQIVDHQIVIGERVINSSEEAANIALLKAEMIQALADDIQEKVDDAYVYIRENGLAGTPVALSVDESAILAQFADSLGLDNADALDAEFVADVRACIEKFKLEYAIPEGYASTTYPVAISSVEYTSQYKFITESLATDKKNYVYTDFTSDVGNIVLVTYSNGTDTVQFILNYNIYSVDVNLGEGKVYTLDKYSFVRIDEGGNG